MHSNSDAIEIIMNDEADEVMKEPFDSCNPIPSGLFEPLVWVRGAKLNPHTLLFA